MPRGAVFLDRDGVINVNREQYVKSWEEFEFLPGVLEALSLLAKAELPVFVVTNQSCLGRGLTTQREVECIHENMMRVIEQHGGRIDEILVCPHTPWDGCDCRKPKPGMLLDIAARHGIDLASSYSIGDALSDIQAALAVDVRPILLLPRQHLTHNNGDSDGSSNWPGREVWFEMDLYNAVCRILAHLGAQDDVTASTRVSQ